MESTMIAKTVELRVSIRQLRIMEQALRSLRDSLQQTNPWLFQTTSKAYVNRIADLQSEIAQYLVEHPEDVSLILPPLEQAEQLFPASEHAPV